RDEVRPRHDRVVGFLLDPDHGVLLDEGQQAVRPGGHRHPLLVDLRPAGRVDRGDDAAVRGVLGIGHAMDLGDARTRPALGGAEYASARTPRCVSESAEATTTRWSVIAVPIS